MKTGGVSDLLHVPRRQHAAMAIDPQTGMLYFYCAERQQIKSIRDEGLSSSGSPLRLLQRFKEADAACDDAILVVDAVDLDGGAEGIHHIPPEAIKNADPYAKPAPITAAGGFVMRRSGSQREVLMIYRRGRWDLPKGKLDEGESVEECAMREVREELGIEALELGRPLGSTVHGYREGKRFMVKTTYWYEMSTTEKAFRPQADEGIEAVHWMSWDEARGVVGYESLRRHMESIDART